MRSCAVILVAKRSAATPPPGGQNLLARSNATLIREWRRNGGEVTPTAEEEWRENGGGGNIESCKNVDTTANEGETPDLVSDALKQIAAKKKRGAA